MEHYTLLPGKNDVLGDRWAHQISHLWDRMKAANPALTSKPWAYNLWQLGNVRNGRHDKPGRQFTPSYRNCRQLQRRPAA